MSGKRTILVVEDDGLVRDFIVDELKEAGYRVLEAENGEAALAVAANEKFDVLFTDIRLPGSVDGWKLAQTVREARPEVAIVYSTGYVPSREMQLHGTRFLMKPYRPPEVLRAIEELLESSE